MGLYSYGKKWAYADAYGKASLTLPQRLGKAYYWGIQWWREVPKIHRYDDDIDDALCEMFSNADGERSCYYFRYYLKRNGLMVVSYIGLACISILCSVLGALTLAIGLALK
jgi:hypothetical protein